MIENYLFHWRWKKVSLLSSCSFNHATNAVHLSLIAPALLLYSYFMYVLTFTSYQQWPVYSCKVYSQRICVKHKTIPVHFSDIIHCSWEDTSRSPMCKIQHDNFSPKLTIINHKAQHCDVISTHLSKSNHKWINRTDLNLLWIRKNISNDWVLQYCGHGSTYKRCARFFFIVFLSRQLLQSKCKDFHLYVIAF